MYLLFIFLVIQPSLAFTMNDKINVFPMKYHYILKPMEIPRNLTEYLLIKFFEIDRFNKIIYILSETGIDRIYYDNEKSNKEKRRDKFIHDVSVIGFQLDPNNHYMYYYNKHSIILIDISTKVKKTIYSSDNNTKIYYLKLNSFKK